MTAEAKMKERTRSVLDPIHGLIRLTETEMRLVDHELFQRLRHIKQNGLLYYVFPAATHTRFEHSLGVLYVAHGMLNSLTLNSRVGLSKGNVRVAGHAERGEAVAFPDVNTQEWTFIYQVTRLAALSHDLGHGPLSHTFDSFAPRRSDLPTVLESKDLQATKPLHHLMCEWGKDDQKDPKHPKNYRVPHEVMSCVYFTKIWRDIGGSPEIALAVCAAILGQHGEAKASHLLEDSLARKWVPLIHDVMASAPADADRMDYMVRDSKAIGVTYGLFDRNRVLKSLLCYRDLKEEEEVCRLGVKHSGLQAIENLMQARYELFVQIYYHKTNRAIARMLDKIGSIAAEQMNIFADEPTLQGWISQYLDLSDEQFFRLLLGHGRRDTPAEVTKIAEDIHHRRLWKRILDPTTEQDAKAILCDLQERFPDVKQSILIDDTKPKALKDLDRGAALLIRHGKQAYEAGKTKSWTQESTIIRALDEADKRFVRIYFEDTDDATAREIRDAALDLAFERNESANAAP